MTDNQPTGGCLISFALFCGTTEVVPFQSCDTVRISSHPAVPAATGEIARRCSTASGTTFKA